MAYSSGTRGLLGEAMSWVAAASILAFGILHFDEIRSATNAALGLPTPAEVAAAEEAARRSPGPSASSGGQVELRAERSGHFHTEAEINGRPVEVMVDTGATLVALSYEDAESAGIYLKPQDFTHGVSTANGRAKVAPVTLGRVSIGDITVRNVQAVVSEPGRLSTSLLGMSFLGRLSRFEMRSGTLHLAE